MAGSHNFLRRKKGGGKPEALAVVDRLMDLAGAVEGVAEALEVQHQDAWQLVKLYHLACCHRIAVVLHLVACQEHTADMLAFIWSLQGARLDIPRQNRGVGAASNA